MDCSSAGGAVCTSPKESDNQCSFVPLNDCYLLGTTTNCATQLATDFTQRASVGTSVIPMKTTPGSAAIIEWVAFCNNPCIISDLPISLVAYIPPYIQAGKHDGLECTGACKWEADDHVRVKIYAK